MAWAWELLTAASLPPSSHLPSLLQSRPSLNAHSPHFATISVTSSCCSPALNFRTSSTAASIFEILMSQFSWWRGETRIGLTEVSKKKDLGIKGRRRFLIRRYRFPT